MALGHHHGGPAFNRCMTGAFYLDRQIARDKAAEVFGEVVVTRYMINELVDQQGRHPRNIHLGRYQEQKLFEVR